MNEYVAWGDIFYEPDTLRMKYRDLYLKNLQSSKYLISTDSGWMMSHEQNDNMNITTRKYLRTATVRFLEILSEPGTFLQDLLEILKQTLQNF